MTAKPQHLFSPPDTPFTPVALTTNFEAGDFVDYKENFRVVELLGRGRFGTVYECEDLSQKKKRVAVKLDLKGKALKQEHKIYMILRDNPSSLIATPSYVGYNEKRSPFYIVISLEGKNFARIIGDVPQKIEPKQLSALAWYGLQAIEILHKLRIVHRDVRMENMCLSKTPGKLKVVAIDFGYSDTSTIDQKTKRRIYPEQGKKKFFKAPYASVRVHEKHPVTEVDDLHSFVYMLIDMCRGWDHFDKTPEVMLAKKKELMGNVKQTLKPSEHFLVPFIKEVFAQPYDGSLPNHKNLIRIISETPGFDKKAYNLNCKETTNFF